MNVALSHRLPFLFLLLLSIVSGEIRSAGNIPLMNYHRADYSFGAQNWDMAQDDLGKIYIANYNGLLCFDGLRWQKAYLPNYSTIRCLLYDKENHCIYAGGSEEFGYFYSSQDHPGLSYTSLTGMLPSNSGAYSEVWNVIKLGETIIFQTDNSLFGLQNNKIETLSIPGRISSSNLIGRKLYIGMEDGRILSIRDGNFGTLKEEGSLEGEKIISVLPFKDNTLLISTLQQGLFQLKGSNISSLKTDYSDYLKTHSIFCSCYQDGKYVFGTISGGVIIYDSNKGSLNLINKESGLKNNTVLNARFDRDGNLWLCLDNGVSYAALDSSCRSLVGEREDLGAGYAAQICDGKLFLGTNQGLYTQKINDGKTLAPAQYKEELAGQVWSITPFDNCLFISADRGLFLYSGGNLSQIQGCPGAYKTLILPGNDNLAISSTYDSFHLIEKINGKWIHRDKISGGNDLNGDFIIDNDNKIWLSHWQKGIYLLPFSLSENRFTSCRLFDHSTGLPANDNNFVSFFEGRPIASTYGGIFSLNPDNNKAVREPEISEKIPHGRRGHLKEMEDGSLLLIDETGVVLAKRTTDGHLDVKEFSGPGIFHDIIAGFTDISRFSPEELLVSTQSGFCLINTTENTKVAHSYPPFVSMIYANQDSLIYQSPLNADDNIPLKLPHELNSLRFEFAYPECNFGEAIEFSSYLENYEKAWSPFSAESTREYTKLSEGNYILHLKVKDNYTGEIQESAFGFSITPPWFRTPWAKGVYTVISFIFLFLLFISVRKKMLQMRHNIEIKQEKELADLRKEAERENMRKDVEIAELKTEQLEKEIKYKSEELSATTMSLINKNEILREIGDQIARVQKMASELPASLLQKNLAKIQANIEENIGKDNDWTAFNKNFDIVYGDYMKRLLTHHPNLSPADKRLCCYIRMGLSSKEIAPLINISFRSVEMARYRLRKKMNLAPEATLAAYLAEI